MYKGLAPHLRIKILALKNAITQGPVLRRLPLVFLGLSVWGLLYAGAFKGITYVRGIELFGEALSGRLIQTVFFSLMGFLALSGVITAISCFYLSKDLPFLRAKPIPAGDIITLKTIETVTESSWMVFSFMPPVIIAFGTAYGAPLYYYPLAFLFFVFFILMASGVGITAAHVLTRFFPAGRLREFFLFSGLLVFLIAYFYLKGSIPAETENPVELVDAIVAVNLDSPLLPSYWMADVAMSMLRGARMDALCALLLFSNGAFFVMFSHAVGLRLFGKNTERVAPRKTSAESRFYPGAARAFFYKDAKIFARDAGQWSQLLIIFALAVVYVYNFKSIPRQTLDALSLIAPFMAELLVLANLLLAGLVLTAVAARFVYSSVSLEGEAFWVIKKAPVDMRDFLMAKFIFGATPVAAITLLIVLASNLLLGVGGFLMAVSLATVLLLSLSISGLGVGMGAAYPRFRYENIASVSMGFGGIAFMLIAFAVVLVTVGLEAWPFYVYLKTGARAWPATVLSASLIVLLNFAVFYVPMRAGVKKCREIEL